MLKKYENVFMNSYGFLYKPLGGSNDEYTLYSFYQYVLLIILVVLLYK